MVALQLPPYDVQCRTYIDNRFPIVKETGGVAIEVKPTGGSEGGFDLHSYACDDP
jgi:hypothetical protein